MPIIDKDDILKFKSINCTIKHPFYVIADFALTDDDKRSQIYQHHTANSYRLKHNCDVSEHIY